MSSIATAVFKATIGLLINKARDKAAEKLKEGDVTDEKFRSVIVREIDQINSKLDGLARNDLLSSISAFEEGIAILFDVFRQASRGAKESRENVTGQEEAVSTADASEDITAVSLQSASAHAEAMSLAKKLANLQMVDLDESSKKLLSDAKKRFEEARSKARDAFSNEGLDTADRILAMMVRVMATILDNVDNPRNALTPCRVCLKELHALPAVKKSFKTALGKGWKSLFGKDEALPGGAPRSLVGISKCRLSALSYCFIRGSRCRRKYFQLYCCLSLFHLSAVPTFWAMSLVGIYPGRASKMSERRLSLRSVA